MFTLITIYRFGLSEEHIMSIICCDCDVVLYDPLYRLPWISLFFQLGCTNFTSLIQICITTTLAEWTKMNLSLFHNKLSKIPIILLKSLLRSRNLLDIFHPSIVYSVISLPIEILTLYYLFINIIRKSMDGETKRNYIRQEYNFVKFK